MCDRELSVGPASFEKLLWGLNRREGVGRSVRQVLRRQRSTSRLLTTLYHEAAKHGRRIWGSKWRRRCTVLPVFSAVGRGTRLCTGVHRCRRPQPIRCTVQGSHADNTRSRRSGIISVLVSVSVMVAVRYQSLYSSRLPITYACRYYGCGRKFKTPGALHTHSGWHKRRDNMDNGIYERQCHTQKVHLPPARTRNMRSLVD